MLLALGRHPMRPAHIHFIVGAPGFEPVTAHMFVAGDQYLDSDAVFGVKESLVVPFVSHDDEASAKKFGLDNPYYTNTISRSFRRPASLTYEPRAEGPPERRGLRKRASLRAR
jgi:protocatechuate 3,4-dioxygenase beta subunit